MIKPEDAKTVANGLATQVLQQLELDIDKTLAKMVLHNRTRAYHKIADEQYEFLSNDLIWPLINQYRNNGWRIEPHDFANICFVHPDDPDYNRDFTKCEKCKKSLFTIFGINTGQCFNPRCTNYFFTI